MRRLPALILLSAIAVVAPFGEGGRAPWALFVLHILILACVALAFLRDPPPAGTGVPPADRPPILAAAAGAGLGLALVSALRASYPLAAGLGLVDLAAPVALGAAALRLAPDRFDRDTLRRAIVVSAVLQAGLALVRYPGGGVLAAGASFLNPNHLAAFLNFGLFLSLPALARPGGARAPRLAWGFAVAVLLVTIFLLESRGGFAALIAGLILLAVLRRHDAPAAIRRIAPGAIVVCVLVAAIVVGVRFRRDADPYRYTRTAIWKASAAMLAERPVLGFGPGMFPHVSARFNFPAVTGPVRYGRNFQGAHSAYFTLAAEAGIPAALLIAAAVAAVAVRFLRSRQDETIFGCGLALAGLLTHAFVEDLAVRPALTLIPALLAGSALASARRRAPVESRLPVSRSSTASVTRRLVWATLIIYVFAIAVYRPWRADREARAALLLGQAGLPRMERAAALNPLQPEYRNDLAMAILNSGPLTREGYARAATNLIEAARLKPIDYRFPLHLARIEARFAPRLFEDRTAMERALGLYRDAAGLAPLDPRPRLELASHLFEMKQDAEALAAAREALTLEPNFLRARVLEASILLDMGRREEARDALRLADGALGVLIDYRPDSGYAREITMDARQERERLAAVLQAAHPPSKRS